MKRPSDKYTVYQQKINPNYQYKTVSYGPPPESSYRKGTSSSYTEIKSDEAYDNFGELVAKHAKRSQHGMTNDQSKRKRGRVVGLIGNEPVVSRVGNNQSTYSNVVRKDYPNKFGNVTSETDFKSERQFEDEHRVNIQRETPLFTSSVKKVINKGSFADPYQSNKYMSLESTGNINKFSDSNNGQNEEFQEIKQSGNPNLSLSGGKTLDRSEEETQPKVIQFSNKNGPETFTITHKT